METNVQNTENIPRQNSNVKEWTFGLYWRKGGRFRDGNPFRVTKSFMVIYDITKFVHRLSDLSDLSRIRWCGGRGEAMAI